MEDWEKNYLTAECLTDNARDENVTPLECCHKRKCRSKFPNK